MPTQKRPVRRAGATSGPRLTVVAPNAPDPVLPSDGGRELPRTFRAVECKLKGYEKLVVFVNVSATKPQLDALEEEIRETLVPEVQRRALRSRRRALRLEGLDEDEIAERLAPWEDKEWAPPWEEEDVADSEAAILQAGYQLEKGFLAQARQGHWGALEPYIGAALNVAGWSTWPFNNLTPPTPGRPLEFESLGLDLVMWLSGPVAQIAFGTPDPN